jgi:hypothetical protein
MVKHRTAETWTKDEMRAKTPTLDEALSKAWHLAIYHKPRTYSGSLPLDSIG